jgi:aminopeptidase
MTAFLAHRGRGEAMDEYEALAKNVVKKSLKIQPKENVIVESWNHGFDAARAIVYQLRAIGARPMVLFEDEDTYWRSVETLPASKLGHVSASEWAALAEADAYVFFPGPADILRYRKNGEKMNAATRYNSEWYKRGRKSHLRGARVLLGYVSPERAQAYGFDFAPWRSMILDAASADLNVIARKGRVLRDLLSREAELEVSAPNGTRLSLELKGRKARLDDGIVGPDDIKEGEFMTNVPPGASWVAPDESVGEGEFVADLPTPYLGRMIHGLRFSFADGKAKWSADSGAETTQGLFDKATGAKDRIAAINIGLNPAVRYGFLQDDLAAGSVEVSIGDNTEWGGKNTSSFSLSARLSHATVRIGKKTVVSAGRLAI